MTGEKLNFDDEFAKKVIKIKGADSANNALKVFAQESRDYMEKHHPGKNADEMTPKELETMNRVVSTMVEAIMIQLRVNADPKSTRYDRDN